jgi:PAS domain S-box-containing protein
LKNDHNLFNTVMNAPIGICILDAATLISEIVNSKFLEVADKPYGAIYGQYYWDSFAEARPSYESALAGVVKAGEPYYADEVELMLIRHGQEERIYVTFVYSPVKDTSGKVTKVAVWVLENTYQVRQRQKETQALNEELAASNEELASSNEELSSAVVELNRSQELLRESNEKLEERITARTKALEQSEQSAQAANEELTAMNEEMTAINEELTVINEELSQSREELQQTITELTAAKRQTERDEKLFRSIALNIPNSLVIVIDRDHRFLTVEGDMMTRLGYDGKDYEGKHSAEISSPERYEASKPLYDRMFSGEQFTIERKGERGNDLLVHLVPLKNEEGEVYAGLIIALDITDVKQAEERSAKLAAIVDSSDDAIVGKTLEGIVTSWNQSAECTFGFTAEEMIGQSILKIIPADRQHEETTILARLRNGERVEHFETLRLTKEGKQVDLSLTISPVKDKEGKIVGISKIARDISERKRDEVRKNDFIGMVSHELKTPLTTLNALTQVTAAKLKTSPDTFLSGAMEKAQVQVRKMTGMINGFLNISRLESGKILIDKKKFDLSELLKEVISETALTTAGSQVHFEPCAPVMIFADADKIGSVISNLVSNAVKYSPKEKPITISCNVLKDSVQVSIKDEGIGIEPEDQEKLFERYYRVENPNTRHISGFGIGLYLSSEIIQHHDGTIGVKSVPGKGSTFFFTLPLPTAGQAQEV